MFNSSVAVFATWELASRVEVECRQLLFVLFIYVCIYIYIF